MSRGARRGVTQPCSFPPASCSCGAALTLPGYSLIRVVGPAQSPDLATGRFSRPGCQPADGTSGAPRPPRHSTRHQPWPSSNRPRWISSLVLPQALLFYTTACLLRYAAPAAAAAKTKAPARAKKRRRSSSSIRTTG